MRKILLQELAYARSGDKGDTSNIGVVVYRPKDYDILRKHLTAERVKSHFGEIVKGSVVRYELPGIKALNFVLERSLGGGVSRSLNLDTHGKTWASLMLALELEIEE